ncbi:MAG TPA: hypothetical protein VHD63_02845, partial [Ktedonobacteraceae bacterium]|nr:hypothetical protein [Ktedonobacteraceae bacterium]
MVEDLGDFQTPLALVEDVLHCLTQTGQQWTRALEPTCGRGNFIEGLLKSKIAPQEIRGIEIQNHYVQHAQGVVAQAKVMATINQANLFDMDLRRDLVWDTPGSLLVIGNPPWITNAQLGILKSNNIPVKSNFKGFKGLEAVLGRANFDIAEFILLKLITELVDEKPTIALLCKTAVARNVLQFAFEAKLPVSGASIRKIESKKFFGAFVDACLFHFDVGQTLPCYQAEIYPGLLATEPESVMGVSNGRFVADMAALQKVSFLDGVCPLTWRQGVKHDAASVMELSYNTAGQLYNKLGEIVDVESEYVYPLLKSSDLGGIEKVRQKKAVLLPQRYIGEDTAHLELHAPRLWHYLMQHSETFTRRKSSIYAGQPAFALFGIGSYTFAPYKVAISGLYKRWQFQVVGPIDEKPVVFDDTCYFIPCSSAW